MHIFTRFAVTKCPLISIAKIFALQLFYDKNSIYQQTIVVKLNRLLGRFIDAIIDSFAEIQKMKDCKTEILLQSEI